MDSRLTVVIPVYNRAEIVGRTLDSLAAQTLRPLSVVLVDNNSGDGTAAVLDEWRRKVSAPDFDVRVVSEKTPGAAAARNAGLALVTTPWVMFFDSDDTMDPEHCRRAMDAADDGTDIVGWDVDLVLKSGRRAGKFVCAAAHFDNIFRGGMATQRWCARTETVRRAGGWNPEALIWNDIELGTRLIAAGARIKRLAGTPTVHVMETAESISNAPALERIARIRTVLGFIETSLPEDKRHYAAFKAALAAGEILRLSDDARVRSAAMSLYCEARPKTSTAGRKFLMSLCFNYIRRIPRGVVPLMSIFVK